MNDVECLAQRYEELRLLGQLDTPAAREELAERARRELPPLQDLIYQVDTATVEILEIAKWLGWGDPESAAETLREHATRMRTALQALLGGADA